MIANPTYYPHDYSDEVLPQDLADTSLQGWARWLGKGGDKPGPDDDPDDFAGWETDIPADGQEFRATETTWLDDVIARRRGDEITFDPPLPEGFDFAAVRFGPGLGWSADDILDASEPLAPQLLEDYYGLSRIDDGDYELLALGQSREVVLVYRADPPRLEVVGEVQ
jgi:hypothetical protein